MIVSESIFELALAELVSEPVIFADTETTGLSVWQKDEMFSIILAGEKCGPYYFNFNKLTSDSLLNGDHLQRLYVSLFSVEEKTFVFHNAKFDMCVLEKAGAPVRGTIYDVEVNERLLYNEHLSYKLDACLKRIGLEKLDTAKKWCLENGAWTWVRQPGKKKKEKGFYYHYVPLDVIIPYAEADVTGMRSLYYEQQIAMALTKEPDCAPVSTLESEFTRTLYEVEKCGIRIDKEYCERAFSYEHAQYTKVAQEFKEITGVEFVDSEKVFAKVFEGIREQFVYTEKGNASFKDAVIENFDSPLVPLIQKHREHYKKAHTYYQNLSVLSDEKHIVHCNFKQAGARTARLSCEKPNLQNIPKREDEDSEYRIRRAFLPREGFFFVEMDYKAMEFRLMLDYAQETELIMKVKDGYDPHQATADLVGISRSSAKTLNFGLLYGMGAGKLAKQLGVSLQEAAIFKRKYFNALPAVETFLRQASYAAKVRGYVYNWFGRRYQFPKPEFSYKAANSIIQGGCADVVRVAMNSCRRALQGKRSRMVLQVHDSLLFEIAYGEEHLIPILKNQMELAYPYKSLPLEVDVKYSLGSWDELVEWGKDGEKAGDIIQRTDNEAFERSTQPLGA